MIRLATSGVVVIAGLLAFGAFLLARGGDAPSPAQSAPDQPDALVIAEPQPEIEKLYFLRDVELSAGDITLVLYGAGPNGTDLVVRDSTAIAGAKETASVAIPSPDGPAATVVDIFRNDALISTVRGATDTDIDYGGLRAAAMPLVKVDDEFDSYDDYIATITAIASDPDFMLLNARPADDFPAPRSLPALTLRLPTVITATDDVFDAQAHEILLRTVLTPLLPEGTRIDWVRVEPQGFAVLGDKDNNRPVMMDDAEIPFLEARYFSVMAHVIGTASLPAPAYETLTAALLDQHDTDSDFARFVTSALGTDCVDCYFLRVDGDFSEIALPYDERTELYTLSYYDLREAP